MKPNNKGVQEAIFAAGCFWDARDVFEKINGVLGTELGYCGGHEKNPKYEHVCSGRTGHAESIRISFDPQIISFAELLDVFWGCHDPTNHNKDGLDVESQYRSAIFWESEEQKFIAEQSKERLNTIYKVQGKNIKTEIYKVEDFYPAIDAEEQYRNYLQKKPKTPGP